MKTQMHSFNVDYAVRFGIHEAIVFEYIRKACMHDALNGIDWTDINLNLLRNVFPYISKNRLSKVLRNLEIMGIIEVKVIRVSDGGCRKHCTIPF